MRFCSLGDELNVELEKLTINIVFSTRVLRAGAEHSLHNLSSIGFAKEILFLFLDK